MKFGNKQETMFKQVEAGEGDGAGAPAEGASKEVPAQTEALTPEKFKEVEERLNSVLAKNNELLNELKKTKSKAQEIEEAKKLAEKEKAELSGDKEKLLKIAQEELESLRSAIKERDQKELSHKEKLLKEARVAEFKKNLNVEFYDESDALSSVEWDKFVMNNDENGNPVGWNQDGVKQAIESFRQKYYYKIKPTDKDVNAGASKGSSKDQMSTKDRLKKYLIDAE